MADNKNLYEQLGELYEQNGEKFNSIEESMKQQNQKLDEILDVVTNLDTKSKQTSPTQQIKDDYDIKQPQSAQVQNAATIQNQQASVLKKFISRSVQEYIWLGSEKEFNKQKEVAFALSLSSIVAMTICTIIVSLSFGIYSTYTLFENIWLLLMLFIFKYVCKAQKNYNSVDYSKNSYEKFEIDADGVLRSRFCKKKYKWFGVLACIAVLLNIFFAWIGYNGIALLVTIFEVLTLAINVLTLIKVEYFFDGYIPIRFTGMNESGTEKVVIVYDPITKKLYKEEDYLKKYECLFIDKAKEDLNNGG